MLMQAILRRLGFQGQTIALMKADPCLLLIRLAAATLLLVVGLLASTWLDK
jgi:hypothetical protein